MSVDVDDVEVIRTQLVVTPVSSRWPWSVSDDCIYCDAQGKGRGKGGLRKVTQRSFIDGGWWMVVILSLMLYIKFGCHPPYSRLLNRTFKNPPPQF